jgi:hypothetical protein
MRGVAGLVVCAWRAGIAGQVVARIAGLLEVGLVPAGAGQAERGRTQLAMQRLGMAGRAHRGIGVGQFLQMIEMVPATRALEFIDGHANSGYGHAHGRHAQPFIIGAARRISMHRPRRAGTARHLPHHICHSGGQCPP